ncbi:MAG: hypothetical protein R3A10_01960 [Caldilineaceae bacterium]
MLASILSGERSLLQQAGGVALAETALLLVRQGSGGKASGHQGWCHARGSSSPARRRKQPRRSHATVA